MNKKLLLLFPLIAMGISSCVKYNGKNPNADKTTSEESSTSQDDSSSSGDSSDSSGSDSSGSDTSSEDPSSSEEPTFGEEVTTYLVLGEYGLYRGSKGVNVESKYLENTIEYVAKIGSPLPTKTDITTTVTGSSFVCWQTYENTGSTKEYSVVPAKEGMILYAKFSGGSGGGGGGGGGDSLPSSGFGFMFTDSTYLVGTLQDEKDSAGRVQYKIGSHDFHTGDTFQLYDFENKAGWVENLDPYSFANTSGSGSYWPYYINKGAYYTCLVDFTAEVYLKMAFEDNVIYFGLLSTPLPDLPDEGGDTPTPGGTEFGIQMNDTAQTFYAGIKQEDKDAQGRDQYKIANLELHEGDEFRLYDKTNTSGWVETLDAYSFGGDPEHGHGETWKTYLDMGTNYYTAKCDMVVDVYLKLKWEDNLVYFGLVSGGDDPVDPPEPTDTGYGIRYSDGSTVKGTEGEESEGFTQWVLENVTFETGDQFQIYDFSTETGWAVTVNTYSFNSDPDSYIIKAESIYAILQDCTVDIYIKLKYGADEIYFDLKSGGGDDPVDPPEPSTIYALVDGVQTAMTVHDEDEYKLTLNNIAVGTTVVLHNGDTAVGYAGIKAANSKLLGITEAGTDGEIRFTATAETVTFYFTFGSTTEAIWGEVTIGTELYLYFSAPSEWSACYAHYWIDGGSSTTWPGTAMNYLKDNDYGQHIYMIELAAADGWEYIIFNNGSGTQTCNIPLTGVTTGTQFWIDGSSYGSGPYAG